MCGFVLSLRAMKEATQPLVTRRELASRWSVSLETLKRRERAGILPFLKLGHGVRYRFEDIEKIEAAALVRR
jgi:predicted site-specific integrase-resolvase